MPTRARRRRRRGRRRRRSMTDRRTIAGDAAPTLRRRSRAATRSAATTPAVARRPSDARRRRVGRRHRRQSRRSDGADARPRCSIAATAVSRRRHARSAGTSRRPSARRHAAGSRRPSDAPPATDALGERSTRGTCGALEARRSRDQTRRRRSDSAGRRRRIDAEARRPIDVSASTSRDGRRRPTPISPQHRRRHLARRAATLRQRATRPPRSSAHVSAGRGARPVVVAARAVDADRAGPALRAGRTPTSRRRRRRSPDDARSPQIVQAIRLQWSRGVGEAHIRLDPEQFGDLTVSLRVERGQVVARLQADAPAVREWLQTNQHALHDGLAEHDLTLDRLEVATARRRRATTRRRDAREQRDRATTARAAGAAPSAEHRRAASKSSPDSGGRLR